MTEKIGIQIISKQRYISFIIIYVHSLRRRCLRHIYFCINNDDIHNALKNGIAERNWRQIPCCIIDWFLLIELNNFAYFMQKDKMTIFRQSYVRVVTRKQTIIIPGYNGVFINSNLEFKFHPISEKHGRSFQKMEISAGSRRFVLQR